MIWRRHKKVQNIVAFIRYQNFVKPSLLTEGIWLTNPKRREMKSESLAVSSDTFSSALVPNLSYIPHDSFSFVVLGEYI